MFLLIKKFLLHLCSYIIFMTFFIFIGVNPSQMVLSECNDRIKAVNCKGEFTLVMEVFYSSYFYQIHSSPFISTSCWRKVSTEGCCARCSSVVTVKNGYYCSEHLKTRIQSLELYWGLDGKAKEPTICTYQVNELINP